MKQFFLFLVVLTSASVWSQRSSYSTEASFSESERILKKLKTAKEDTNTVFLLNDLNEALLDESKPDEAIFYGKKAVDLARKIHFLKGEAISCANLGHGYSYNIDNPNALKMFFLALQLNRKLDRKNSIIDTYVNIGTIYDDMANYPKAMKYYLKALKAAPRNEKFDLLADIHQNLGITFGSLGNHNESLRQHFQALKFYEKINNNLGIADASTSIGNAYAEKMNYDQSLAWYKKALKGYMSVDEQYGLANVYSNIATLYTEQDQLEEVLGFYKKALVIYTKLDDISGQILTYNGLGNANYKLKNYAASETAYAKALSFARNTDDKVEIATALIGLSRLYADLKNYSESKKCGLEALETSQSIGNKVSIRNSFDALSYSESCAGNFENAFNYQKSLIQLKDSINNERTTQNGIQIALSYSFQKEKAAQKLKHQRAMEQLRKNYALANQRKLWWIIVLVLVLGFSLVVVATFRRAYSAERKLSEVLAGENEHKEVLLQEVHHRINNSLQMIGSLLNFQADTVENEEIKAYLLKSENRLQAMSVMHQLLQFGNSKLEVDIKDYFERVLSFYNTVLETKKEVEIEVNIPSVLIHTQKAMPLALILNELITNALKYAFPSEQGKIEISFYPIANGEEWELVVRDNGIGMNETKINSEKGSLGLRLVHLMSRQVDGTLTTDTSQGTSVAVRFKL